jgi:hypothetical protein
MVQLAEIVHGTKGLVPDVKVHSSRRPSTSTNRILGIPLIRKIRHSTLASQRKERSLERLRRHQFPRRHIGRVLRHPVQTTGQQTFFIGNSNWKILQNAGNNRNTFSQLPVEVRKQLPTLKTTYLAQDSYTRQDNNTNKNFSQTNANVVFSSKNETTNRSFSSTTPRTTHRFMGWNDGLKQHAGPTTCQGATT